MSTHTIALVSDLMFSSKITATANSVGATVVVVRTLEQLENELTSNPATTVMIDLEATAADPIQAIAYCLIAQPKPRIIAFGPHVNVDLLAKAKQAGADDVMPRGAFTTNLQQLLVATPTH
ncbi:MAG: hypothetical protein IH984_16345 [Planctomycetes bacterium]|nr:hypothetical protein [Planctomycetota bacterium]